MRFHRQYGNKTVDVTGEIDSFDLRYNGSIDIGLITIYREWGSTYSFLDCNVPAWNKAFIADLDIGDTIHVIGTVAINNASWIDLKDCRLAE